MNKRVVNKILLTALLLAGLVANATAKSSHHTHVGVSAHGAHLSNNLSRIFSGSSARHHSNSNVSIHIHTSIGHRVSYLPRGYIRFSLGSRQYYRSGSIYYSWDQRHREYVVIRNPHRVENSAPAPAPASTSTDIYVYPRLGQSEEQTSRDRYDCYLWAVEQSSFDPTEGDAEPELADDYRRATTACLDARGYSVK